MWIHLKPENDFLIENYVIQIRYYNFKTLEKEWVKEITENGIDEKCWLGMNSKGYISYYVLNGYYEFQYRYKEYRGMCRLFIFELSENKQFKYKQFNHFCVNFEGRYIFLDCLSIAKV